MNIQKIKVYIINALEDIKENLENYRIEYEGNCKTFGEPLYKNSNISALKLIIPNILGLIMGFAVARLFNLKFLGYIILGVVFAFLIGTYKSHEYDKISWKYALIKNFIIMFFVIFLGIITIFSWG